MRITSTPPVSLEPREKPATASGASTEAKDTVALSPAADAAATARKEDMTARIARIRALVQQGAYPIDLDMLASRIVHDELLRSKGSA